MDRTQARKDGKTQIFIDRALIVRAHVATGHRHVTAAALVRGLLAEAIDEYEKPTPHQIESRERNAARREAAEDRDDDEGDVAS